MVEEDVAAAVQDSHGTSSSGYKRELGTWHVVLYAIGAILGPAIAYAPVYTVALAGPIGILSWVVAMVMIIPIALVYAELGTAWPKAGGVAYYPSKSNGPLVGAINGWSSFIGYLLVGPVIVFAFVEYLSFYVPSLYSATGVITLEGILVSEGILVLVFLINTLRIRHMGNINAILTFVTIGLIAVMLIGLSFNFNASNLNSPSLGGLAPFGATGFFSAITLTIFGYGGFRQPVDYAEEAKNPGRSIPLAVIFSVIITAVIYSLEALVFTGATNFSAFKIAPGNWGAFLNYGAPYATQAQTLVLPAIVIVAVVVALIATFKDGVIYYGGTARVTQVLAKEDRFLPKVLQHVNKHGVPSYSVILVFVVMLVLIVLGKSLATIIGVMVDGLLISYAPGCISLMVFRKTDPDVKRPFKLPFANVLAPIAFIVANLMVLWSGFAAIEIIVPLDLAGMLLVVIHSMYNKVSGKSIMYGIWMPVFYGIMVLVSYFGSSFFGGLGFIPFPWDSVVFIVITAIFYFIAVEMGVRANKHGATIAAAE